MKSFFVVSIHLLRQNKNALEDVASPKARGDSGITSE